MNSVGVIFNSVLKLFSTLNLKITAFFFASSKALRQVAPVVSLYPYYMYMSHDREIECP